MKMKIRSKDYEANALAIMELPFVKKLVEENKKLKKRNKALKNLIYSLPEFRQPLKTESDSDDDVQIVDKPVKIKKEQIVYEIEENDDDTTESPKVVGDLTRCEFSLNSFTDANAPTMDNEKVYTDDGETVLVKKQKIQSEEEEEVEVEEEEEEEEEVEVEEVEVEEVEVEEEEEEEEEEEVEVEEVEVEEEEEEEEEEVEVEEEEEEEEEEVEEEEEEEEEEVFEVEIKGKTYYTTNEQSGPIFAVTEDEDVGDEVGVFKNGKATFYKKK